jgi:hypothetical protein
MPLCCAGSRNERVAIDETGVRVCKQAINFPLFRGRLARPTFFAPAPRARAGPAKVNTRIGCGGGGSAGKWQIPTEAGGTFWLLPSSPVFKIERPKLTILASGI